MINYWHIKDEVEELIPDNILSYDDMVSSGSWLSGPKVNLSIIGTEYSLEEIEEIGTRYKVLGNDVITNEELGIHLMISGDDKLKVIEVLVAGGVYIGSKPYDYLYESIVPPIVLLTELSLTDIAIKGNGANYLFGSTDVVFDTVNLRKINLIGVDTSECISAVRMFSNLKLREIDLSGQDFSKLVDTRCMFASCKLLNKITFSNIEMSSLETVDFMFSQCEKLEELDLSMMNSNNLISVDEIFGRCRKLTRDNIKLPDNEAVLEILEAELDRLKYLQRSTV